jgi:hypothetical protein
LPWKLRRKPDQEKQAKKTEDQAAPDPSTEPGKEW